MLTRLLQQAARALPSQCCACRTWGTARVCEACLGRFAREVPRCSTCALQLASSAADDLTNTSQQCGECLLHPGPLDACWAAVDYGYPWDALLGQLKFQGQHGLGGDPSLARSVADVMVQLPSITAALQRASVVIPIPLSHQRLRQRGFNQALEMSKHLLGTGSVDGLGAGSAQVHNTRSAMVKLKPDLLLRTRDTPSQVGLARAERLQNLRHAFAVEPTRASQVQGAHVVLVDDVTTTTATLCAAALALRTAGAAQVVGVVFARTPV
jgi:predicted amidophosphoribosyltransferase